MNRLIRNVIALNLWRPSEKRGSRNRQGADLMEAVMMRMIH
jgi:hypothetical protein